MVWDPVKCWTLGSSRVGLMINPAPTTMATMTMKMMLMHFYSTSSNTLWCKGFNRRCSKGVCKKMTRNSLHESKPVRHIMKESQQKMCCWTKFESTQHIGLIGRCFNLVKTSSGFLDRTWTMNQRILLRLRYRGGLECFVDLKLQ